jgi:hypothetical protein
MYYQICISGTNVPVEETKHLKTEEEINLWYSQNQIPRPLEGDPEFESWEYEDHTKYIILRFDDNGVFIDDLNYVSE